MDTVIQLAGISKGFGSGRNRRQVIHDLTLKVGAGEVFGFLGPNGAGKSTTIKLLLHFLRPDQGRVEIMGEPVGQVEFRRHLGYLPEFPCLYENLTAQETLQFAGRLSGMAKAKLQERQAMLLERVDLASAARQRVGTFSKGMKQRLGFAVALIHDPGILILDEPMSGLDPLGRHLTKQLILELKSQGKTIFFSSHILSDIETLCSRIGIIHQGELLYQGGLADFTQGGEFEARFIQTIAERGHGKSH